MATINNVEVQGDKNGNDYGLANLTDLASKELELTNRILANSTAIADNLSEINLHKSNEDRHVTPALINSLVRKEVLGLYYTAAQVAEMINDISVGGGAHLKVVDELPETGLEQIIYLVPNGQTGDNVKDEYIWIDNKWEVIGSTSIDLTDYYTKNEVNNKISELDSKYVKSDDTTLVKLNNLNEINLQEDHYNAWFGYRDGKVTNWKFGDGTEGGLANIYVKDLYLNNQSLSDLLGDKAEDSDLTAHTSNANIHVTVSDKNKWNNTYTKVEVDNKISGLVNSAPETLNTLNALAEALGNDENFAANVATQIGLKANSSDLSTVATSGSYDDLDDKPTIPTKTSELINDSNFLTGEQDIGDLTDHISNIDIHVTTADKVKWNGKQDALSEEQLNNIDDVVNKADESDLENYLPKTTTLEDLGANFIPFHNAYPRGKYLGTSISSAQNTAIKNRTYNDLFIGDYWTINGINWRIVAIDYYYNIGDTNFDKGNIIVMPDTTLYDAKMNDTNTTAGAYHGSLMRTQNLNNARTIARNAFGSHLANHRIILANSVDGSGPNSWAWCDSDGVELPNEVQIYGTRVWGSALKGYDVGTQKQQFPLMAIAPQFVNTRQTYWLQDVSSTSVSSNFASVDGNGYADGGHVASGSLGVRPSVTLTGI